ncbi:hypothetical protein DPMN_123426 [Dreissena polymorpha]|uniref:Uncharacterized protein n=1 Tax=Dreissena polymorpha TaxID=45954 RepID=A0A9D4JRA3_DREPO|nr:hypothetical protein DPMN_123426 [Dreissena polymorpha]
MSKWSMDEHNGMCSSERLHRATKQRFHKAKRCVHHHHPCHSHQGTGVLRHGEGWGRLDGLSKAVQWQ